MNKNFDNASIQKEIVDISEYKSNIEFGSKHIPDELAIGKLPRKYNISLAISQSLIQSFLSQLFIITNQFDNCKYTH